MRHEDFGNQYQASHPHVTSMTQDKGEGNRPVNNSRYLGSAMAARDVAVIKDATGNRNQTGQRVLVPNTA